MSGNRTLHREQVEAPESQNDGGDTTLALWGLTCTPSMSALQHPPSSKAPSSSNNKNWMIWVTGSDGGHSVRGYTVGETSLAEKQAELNASALQVTWTHELCDDNEGDKEDKLPSLGGSCLSVIRNYSGQDCQAGEALLLSLDLSNVVRVWNLSSDKNDNATPRTRIPATTHFTVPQATGTAAALLPPRLVVASDSAATNALEHVIVVALPCLDGTLALVSTGIPLFNPHLQNDSNNASNNKKKKAMELPEAGTVVDTLGNPSTDKKDVALSLEWNPTLPQTLAVGRAGGTVDVFQSHAASNNNTKPNNTKHYRLNHLGESPVRAIAFTTDGHLLVAGNDQGRLCVWDCSSLTASAASPPALVHHVLPSSSSAWMLRAVAVDARRFCTLSSDKRVSVWNVGQMHAAVHTFQSNQELLWSLSLLPQDEAGGDAPRLVAGSDDGWLEVFSLEAG